MQPVSICTFAMFQQLILKHDISNLKSLKMWAPFIHFTPTGIFNVQYLQICTIEYYSVLPIYCGCVLLQNWIYRGRMLDPIFSAQEHNIFLRNRGHSLDPIRGRQFFAKSAYRDSLCSRLLETIFREINSSLPVNAGWNTRCAMVSHARWSIDTSIVSS